MKTLPQDLNFVAEMGSRGYVNLVDDGYAGLFDPSEIRADTDDIACELAAAGIRHEQKPVPFDPRPLLIGESTYRQTAAAFEHLFPLLERGIDLFLQDGAVRRFFSFQPRHETLIRLGAHYTPRIQVCRYDFTLDQNGKPKIYELNTHCPAGAAFAVHFHRVTASSRIRARLEGLGVSQCSVELEEPNSFAAAMLASAERNHRSVANVAVLNSRYLTMQNELDLIADQFRALGVNAVRGYVEDLRYLGGRLVLGDLPIDLTYNKFDDSWGPDAYECAFSRTTGEVADYLEAYRSGAVLAVNSFPSMYLTEQKSMLAFLHSDLFAGHCTAQERKLIHDIVPETVIVRLASQAWLDEVARQRRDWVLKRSLDTRGRTLVIGRSVADAQWHQAMAAAAASEPGDDWILQRLAPPLHSRCDRADRQPEQVFTTLSCFLLTGRAAGLIVRSSTEEVTNVGRVGFCQAPIVVAP